MVLVKPVIFQIVGYQNSGKTTFILKLIQALKKQGLKTATIKHHGHGGKPEEIPEKDSTKHLNAGAQASLVEGDGRMILQLEKSQIPLEDQIMLLESLYPDIILIEGHKHKDYPKLVLVRGLEDLPLLSTVTNVKIIINWTEELNGFLKEQQEIPCFSIQEPTALMWVTDFLKNMFKK